MGDGVLTRDQILDLPPMLFGSIRWQKGLGAPVGDPCGAFRVLVEEHTVSQFRIGPGGRPEVIPGTGIWKAPELADCWSAPDEGDMHVVRFNARDVHLNAFPDGKYRITVELTGNWGTPRQGDPAFLQRFLGFRKIEPMAYYVSLKDKDHIVSLDFEVVNDLSLLRLHP